MTTAVHKRGPGGKDEPGSIPEAIAVPLGPPVVHDEAVDPALVLVAEAVLAFIFWSVFTEHIPTVPPRVRLLRRPEAQRAAWAM